MATMAMSPNELARRNEHRSFVEASALRGGGPEATDRGCSKLTQGALGETNQFCRTVQMKFASPRALFGFSGEHEPRRNQCL
jgi:hypothetical protein